MLGEELKPFINYWHISHLFLDTKQPEHMQFNTLLHPLFHKPDNSLSSSVIQRSRSSPMFFKNSRVRMHNKKQYFITSGAGSWHLFAWKLLLCAVCIVSLQLHQVCIIPLASRELRMYRDPSMQCNMYKICQKKIKIILSMHTALLITHKPHINMLIFKQCQSLNCKLSWCREG